VRSISRGRSTPEEYEPSYLGDSIARFDGDALVVDTVGFNEMTWLNDAGARHSDALHLVERIRPVQAGRYLEYRVTADDPKTLAKPYTYTRYYQRVNTELQEDFCDESALRRGGCRTRMLQRATPSTPRKPAAKPENISSINRAFHELRELIVRGNLPPGAWIVESALAERLGFSRTPIRGALHWLRREGYVVEQTGSRKARIMVAPLTQDDARELYGSSDTSRCLPARLR
jgi:biotin operon repressor